MTKNQAIRVATDRCSPVYKVAQNQHTFNILDPKTFEWIRQPIRSRANAQLLRTEFVINEARALLGQKPIQYRHQEGVRFDYYI